MAAAQKDGKGLGILESLSYGGMPCSASLPKLAKSEFPSVLLGQAYGEPVFIRRLRRSDTKIGLTETNSIAIAHVGDDYLARPDSAGLPTPVNDLLIVDSVTNKKVPVGEIGEIWLRGPK